MHITRKHLRWAGLSGLWLLVALVGFVMTVQILLVLLTPQGTWHLPRIYKVTIKEFDPDPQTEYPAIFVTVEDAAPTPAKPVKPAKPAAVSPVSPEPGAATPEPVGEEDAGEERPEVIYLPRKERLDLKVDDEVWILDNLYWTRLQPHQFRLSPQRLLVQFPQPVLVLALLLIWRIRRTQAKVAKAEREAPRERVVVKDDFHSRAQRFAAPKDPDQ